MTDLNDEVRRLAREWMNIYSIPAEFESISAIAEDFIREAMVVAMGACEASLIGNPHCEKEAKFIRGLIDEAKK